MDCDSPLVFPTLAEWRCWLKKHHAVSPAVWLLLARKQDATPGLGYAEALDEALCYGWIDGQRRSANDGRWLQRFCPRGPGSIWSKINRTKALALIGTQRMQPSGIAAIERAKQNGQWDAAYEGQRTASVPPDLEAALEANRAAAQFFETLSSQNRYAILFRLQKVKKPETRARNLAKFVDMLARKETIYPQKS